MAGGDEVVLKRDALDAVFSNLIRERDDWTCQRCQRPYPERKGQGIHCSHIVTRAKHVTRWFPDNAIALCNGCHRHVASDRHEHESLARRLLGDMRYEFLMQRKQEIRRYRASDRKEMKSHYTGELERLRELRRNGAVGPLEVVSWD